MSDDHDNGLEQGEIESENVTDDNRRADAKKSRGRRNKNDPDPENSDRQDEDSEDGNEDGGGEGEKTPFYKRPKVLIIGAIILIIAVVMTLLWWLNARKYESTDDAFVDAHIVRLAPQVAGVITDVPVAPNRHVQAGDLLVSIQPDSIETQLEQRRANVEQSQASYAQSLSAIETTRKQYQQALAQIAQPRAQLVKAREDLARYIYLRSVNPSAVAPTTIDAARAAVRDADAQVSAAERAAESARAQIRTAEDAAKAQAASVKSAQAQVRETQINVAYNRIVAPLSGVVSNVNVNKGSYVAPGQQMMALIPDNLWVTANFKETQLARMKIGQPVEIVVDAFPGIRFDGRVDSFQRGAGQAFQILPPQNTTGNFVKVVQRVPVRITFVRPNPLQYPIGPGMSVVPTVKVQ